MNTRQAPELRAIGEKYKETNSIKGKAIRTHLLETIIMNGLGDRDMAQLKIMLFLTGNAADADYRVAEKTICDRCNISESGYKKARKALVERGWIKHDKGSITVDYDAIYASGSNLIADEGFTENTSKGFTENTYNNINNNINEATVTHASLDFPVSQETTAPSAKAEATGKPDVKESEAGYSISKEMFDEIPVMTNPTYFLETMSKKGIPIHYVNKVVVEIDGTLYKGCDYGDSFDELMKYAKTCGKAKPQKVEAYIARLKANIA